MHDVFFDIADTCGTPPHVDFATPSSKEESSEGDVVTYTCDPRTRMDGDNTITCQPDLNWSEVGFQCGSK